MVVIGDLVGLAVVKALGLKLAPTDGLAVGLALGLSLGD